ncbi:MAG: PocR ligand-binding domain-containing protein [Clostridia bacterium]|nr:PocR ligand-binding domain-containing protein [Clostridia bacterium]
MGLKLNTAELKDILSSFYTLTKIRPVIFDNEFHEIMSYPEDKCAFCREVRMQEGLLAKCHESDRNAFLACKATEDTYVYHCHAGLLEAVKPLKHKNRIIGYIMFGQITDIKEKHKLQAALEPFCLENNITCGTDSIKYKNQKQILAASKLLEICTDYILMKEMVEAENNLLADRLKEYIAGNLDAKLEINDLCEHFKVSRTKLYEVAAETFGIGIAAYIKNLRMQKAKELLKNTELSISEISTSVGFEDYNYFSRVFKKTYGISPRHCRK